MPRQAVRAAQDARYGKVTNAISKCIGTRDGAGASVTGQEFPAPWGPGFDSGTPSRRMRAAP